MKCKEVLNGVGGFLFALKFDKSGQIKVIVLVKLGILVHRFGQLLQMRVCVFAVVNGGKEKNQPRKYTLFKD